MEGDGWISADQLFRMHAPYIKTFLRRLGLPDLWLDDAVQDVFIVAYALGGYQPGPATSKSWLGSIAVRVAANARRKHRRYAAVVIPIGDAPERVLRAHADGHQAPDVYKVLAALEAVDRDVLSRFYLQGQSCPVIASALEVPVGTVYRRLHDARKHFAALLS
jgi:RNA polymerase sigma-70 factor (ECF subfamily)